MALMKWLLFLPLIAGTGAWKSNDYSVGEQIMKTILESCHENDNFPNPVVIFGDFNTFIDGVSIIRINDFLNVNNYRGHQFMKLKASSVVLMEERPLRLLSHLKLLRRTKLWDNRIPFFIVGKNTASCENSRSLLRVMKQMEILNPIYICGESINNPSEIFTLNLITNYAPYPWKRVEGVNDLNVFRQNFYANISCTHLSYDKTKILNGYDITVVDWDHAEIGYVPGVNYFNLPYWNAEDKALRMIIIALNASGHWEYEEELQVMVERYYKGTTDIMAQTVSLDSLLSYPSLFPHNPSSMIAAVKRNAEVSTLEKIRRLWSPPVLIAAAVALAVFFLILMIKRWSFGAALLDITRFLTYTSIQTDNRYHSFRIYFTTMLIFIVISNGVFQGKIAAFLTTRERCSAPESIHEAVKLGYQMYVHRAQLSYAKRGCPTCRFKGVSTLDECIEVALNSTKSLCVINQFGYEKNCMLSPLARVKEPLIQGLVNFKSRKNWPLYDRFNSLMMRLLESGLTDFWLEKIVSTRKAKRQSMEDELSSTEYRPVRLYKLTFAFQLLAAGLSLATIVFFLELCWARYVNP